MDSNIRRSHKSSSDRRYHGRDCSVFAPVSATWLNKLAKHLVVIACIMILGRSSGHSMLDPLAIFALILVASVIHCLSRVLQQRFVRRPGSVTGVL
jgi:hypothetical protein